tara:strand:+ start:602 stop:1264 length:663 start_codon:yes stop_codon:yes gene_type:complete
MSDLMNDEVEEVVEETAETEETEEIVEEAAEATETDETKVLLSGDGDDGADAGVPETYEYAAPEGVEIDEGTQAKLDAFGEEARGMKLSQSQYQSIIEYDTKRSAEAIEAGAAAYTDRINGWADATKKDTELGGEDLNRNLAVAKLGMDTYGTPELASILAAPSPENPDGLGLGNHPEVIRLFNRVGATLKESDLIEGDTTVQGESGLKKMYPSMFQEAS